MASVTFNNVTLFIGGLTKVTDPVAATKRIDIFTTPLRLANENSTSLIVKLYPNPVSDQLNVTLPAQVVLPVFVNVLDENGRIVQSFFTNEYNVTLQVSSLSAGNYILSGYDAQQNKLTAKMMKE
jgi:hypothetical protein